MHGTWHEVSDDTLCRVLDAMGLKADTDAERTESRKHLADQARRLPPLLTATLNEPVRIPFDGP